MITILKRLLAPSYEKAESDARRALARFYMAHGFYPEAKGESEFLLADPGPKSDEPLAVMVHAVASIL